MFPALRWEVCTEKCRLLRHREGVDGKKAKELFTVGMTAGTTRKGREEKKRKERDGISLRASDGSGEMPVIYGRYCETTRVPTGVYGRVVVASFIAALHLHRLQEQPETRGTAWESNARFLFSLAYSCFPGAVSVETCAPREGGIKGS